MPTTTATLVFYDHVSELDGSGAINWSAHTFQVLLTTSVHAPNVTHVNIADIDNEVVGSGYARQTLTTVSYTRAGSVTTIDADDAQWTASGGDLTARYWHLWDQTSDILVAYGLLDATNQDVTTTDGSPLDLRWNVAGIYTKDTTGA